MAKSRVLRVVGGWSAVVLAAMIISYCSELPKHRFEERGAESAHGVPGARIIGSATRVNILSPVSWLWPVTTEWSLALPDPRIADRFYTITQVFGEKQPVIFLVDADCQTRSLTFFGPDEPETAAPARDLFGNPVVATNGKTYRRLGISPAAPADWLTAFCDTEWSAEREAVAALRNGSK
jgi:hypothetical protein